LEKAARSFKKVATKGKCNEKLLKKVVYLGALVKNLDVLKILQVKFRCVEDFAGKLYTC
jgi:hypothetical protein